MPPAVAEYCHAFIVLGTVGVGGVWVDDIVLLVSLYGIPNLEMPWFAQVGT
jgi:hypothetical protein